MPEMGFPVFLKESLLLSYSANYGHVTMSTIQQAARASDVVNGSDREICKNACCALIGMYFLDCCEFTEAPKPMLS